MKQKIVFLQVSTVLTMLLLASCTKNELINSEKHENISNLNNSANVSSASIALNESLIAYKKSDHKKAVGWYLGVTSGTIANIPDSMDIVNLFGALNGTPEQKEAAMTDIAAQKAKGTTFLSTVWLKWSSSAPPASTYNDSTALAARVKGMVDNIKSWGIDGICVSFESPIMYDIATMEKFLFELAKYKSDDFSLTIETNSGSLGLSNAALALVDMIFIQSYFGSSSGANAKVDQFINQGFPKKDIFYIAADFQASYNSTSASVGPLRLKQTYQDPVFAAKVGGFGVYGMQYDVDYKYYREMIQYFNPANDPNDVDLDGILNSEDTDDDNDGISDVNEGYTSTPTYKDYRGYVSWVSKDALSYTNYLPAVGFYFAGYKDNGTEELTFTINDAIPNTVNTLSFNYASLNPSNINSNAVKLYVNNVQKFSFNTTSGLKGTSTMAAPASVDHGPASITFTPTSSTAVIKVTWTTPVDNKAGSDGAFSKFNLNDTKTTNSRDTDGDGIPDHQDKDSNNDGIPDQP